METNDPKYKHKPSEKHTLEEVLKSLQDLIRNDLEESAPGAAKPESAPAAARDAVSRDENTAVRREDFAPQSPGAGPVNLNAVMRSLNDLIGNELNVGDEPAPAGTAPAATHEEFLATNDSIEEYIPEELGQLGDELNLGDELVLPEPETPAAPVESPTPDTGIETAPLAEAPPEPVAPLDDEIILESFPEEMVPLDEALTLDEPLEIEPAPVEAATPELPGEISPELLDEAEPTPPPAAPEIPPPMNATAAPGLQQELLLEEPPPIELRMPPSPEIVPAPAAEPETAPAPVAEKTPAAAESALPTIEVEESLDAGDYFDVATLPAETTAAEPEAVLDFDVEISVEPENAPLSIETPPATPVDATPVVETGAETLPAAEPAEQKITLEIIDVPLDESANSWPSVDFDTLVTEPVTPEPATAPVGAEATAPEAEPPTLVEPEPVTPTEAATAPPAAESPPGLATEPGTPEPVETAPVMPPAAESAPQAEAPPVATEPAATSAPESPNLDDIPVLNEVVAPPAGSAPAKPPVSPAAVAPPASDHARDVVVRAVARLNVEMRKTGGTGLDTKTILRLQQLMRQELEKGEKK